MEPNQYIVVCHDLNCIWLDAITPQYYLTEGGSDGAALLAFADNPTWQSVKVKAVDTSRFTVHTRS